MSKPMTRDEAVQCLADVADVSLYELRSGLADGTYEDDDISGWSSNQIEAALKVVNAPPPAPRVAVCINGGVLQWALADRPGIRVDVVDFDNEGTTGFDFELIRDKDGDQEPGCHWQELAEAQPAYFAMLDCAPTVDEDGNRASAEIDPDNKFHIITDVMQCGPDGVHESFDGYYGGDLDDAVKEHERELRFYFGEYKTGPAGRQIHEPTNRQCGQCEGTGRTQSMSNLEDEECPVCDGSGELPDAE